MQPNIAKVFEMTFQKGFDPKTGKQIGPKTGDLRDFKTFEEVYELISHPLDFIWGIFI
ncbi:pyruvate formate lyase family protein [Thermodesulfobacteriota bacterium]